MPSRMTSYIGFAPKISLTIYPKDTPRMTGTSNVNCQVSSTTMTIAVMGALTIDAKNVAMQIMTMQSPYTASMPIAPQSFETSAPMHAPIDSMGMNIPHGTPAPRLSAVARIRMTRTSNNDTTTGEENIVATVCSFVAPFVPRD